MGPSEYCVLMTGLLAALIATTDSVINQEPCVSPWRYIILDGEGTNSEIYSHGRSTSSYYENDLDCRWTISWNPRKLDLTYAFQGSVDIRNDDSLTIQDGATSTTYPGHNTSSPQTVTSGALMIRFRTSNFNVGKGFRLTLTTLYHIPPACKRTLPDREPIAINETGVNWAIKSWGMDFNEVYLNDLRCYWRVTWDPQKLDLSYETDGTVEILRGTHVWCDEDRLTIGSKLYCGTTKVTGSSSAGVLLISFVTDVSDRGKGFLLKLTTTYHLEDACRAGRPRVIPINNMKVYRNIYSWGRNLEPQINYIPNLNCQWRVVWNLAKRDLYYEQEGVLELLGTHHSCANDVLTIKDGTKPTQRHCGTKAIVKTLATTGTLVVTFTTAASTKGGRGFRLMLTTIYHLVDACKDGKRPQTVEMRRHGTTRLYSWGRNLKINYLPSLNCLWTVKWNKYLFNVFYATEGPSEVHCPADVLKVNSRTICRSNVTEASARRVKLANGTARVSFISAANSRGGKGFMLKLTTVYNPYACRNESYHPHVITLKNPGSNSDVFSWGYDIGQKSPRGKVCRWKVKWNKNKLDLTYETIGVVGVARGQLQIGGRNITSRVPVTPSTAQAIGIRFRSLEFNKTGFRLKFTTTYHMPQACRHPPGKLIVLQAVGINSEIFSWGRRFPTPENYIPDLKCKWIVQWDAKKFDLFISTRGAVQIASGSPLWCDEDKLLLQDGNTTKTLCRNMTLTNYLVSSGRLVVDFITNSVKTGIGIQLLLRTAYHLEDQCLQTKRPRRIVLTKEGIDHSIYSWGQNFNPKTPYTQNLQCEWVVTWDRTIMALYYGTAASGNIAVRSDGSCADKLTIRDGSSPYAINCGEPFVIVSRLARTGTLTIRFQSDFAGNRLQDGFMLELRTVFIIPQACKGGETISLVDIGKNEQVMTFGNSQGKDYSVNLRCVWTVRWPKDLFDVSYTSRIPVLLGRGDTLTVTDGSYTNNAVTGRTFTGTGSPGVGTGSLQVVFTSDAYGNDKGFKLDITTTFHLPKACMPGGETITLPIQATRLIRSWGRSVGKNYLKRLTCEWNIKWNPHISIFTYEGVGNVDIKSNDPTICGEDALTIQAIKETSTLTHKVCGTSFIPKLVPTSGILNVRFTSDDADEGKGFALKLTTVYRSSACRRTETIVISKSGVMYLASVGRDLTPPKPYSKNKRCEWNLQWDPQKFEVSYQTVGDFSIISGINCNQDYLRIRDGVGPATCIKTRLDQPVVVKSGFLNVLFISNSDDNVAGGFRLSVGAAESGKEESSPGCRGNTKSFYAAGSSLVSFVGNPSYKPGLNCSRIFILQNPQLAMKYSVSNNSIKGNQSKNCLNADRLTITDDNNKTQFMCGSTSVPMRWTDSRKIKVEFVSNSDNVVGNGFNFKVDAYFKACGKGLVEKHISNSADGDRVRFQWEQGSADLGNIVCTWAYTWNREDLIIHYAITDINISRGTDSCIDILSVTDGAGKDTNICGTQNVTGLLRSGKGVFQYQSKVQRTRMPRFDLRILPKNVACENERLLNLATSGRTVITFYNPANYENNLNCKWTVIWDQKVLSLRYRLERSDIKGCPSDASDWLTSADGNGTASKLCHSQDVYFVAKSGILKFQFKSNSDGHVGKGFVLVLLARVKGKQTACTGKTSTVSISAASQFLIESQGREDNFDYVKDLDCYWSYTWDSSAFNVTMTFIGEVDIRSNDQIKCQEDVLVINTIEGKDPERTCGQTPKSEVVRVISTGYVSFHFHSNSDSVVGKGFGLIIKAVHISPKECSNKQPKIINIREPANALFISSWGRKLNRMYEPGVSCSWTVVWDVNSFVSSSLNLAEQFISHVSRGRPLCIRHLNTTTYSYVWVTQKTLTHSSVGPLDIRSGESCAKGKDSLHIQDGQGAPECIDKSYGSRVAKSGSLVVRFFTNHDNEVGKGFNISLHVAALRGNVCNGTEEIRFTGPTVYRAMSWGRKLGLNYLPGMSCVWKFTWDVQRFVVKYSMPEAMALEGSMSCMLDSVTIRVPGEFFPTMYCGRDRIATKTVTAGSFEVEFYTDQNSLTVDKGFELVVSVTIAPLPKGCSYGTEPSSERYELDSTKKELIITSVDREKSLPYIPGVHCHWIISWIQYDMDLAFWTSGAFDIKSGDTCDGDTLVITEAFPKKSDRRGCSKRDIYVTKATRGTLHVLFDTNDDDKVGKGFKLIVRVVNKHEECTKPADILVDAPKPLSLTSWGYTDGVNYLPNLKCEWRIRWDKQRWTLNYKGFGEIDIEDSGYTCRKDYLELQDGQTLPKRFCGKKNVLLTGVKSGELLVTFVSDEVRKTTGKGFKLEVEVKRRPLPKGCSYYDTAVEAKVIQMEDSKKEYSIMSLDRDKHLNYIPGLNCAWTVTWDTGLMDVTYETEGVFDVISNCIGDTLVITDGDAKPKCIESSTQKTNATSGSLSITFKSNEDLVVGSGFQIVMKYNFVIPSECKGGTKKYKVTDSSGTAIITSFGYSEGWNYLPGLNCKHTIMFNQHRSVLEYHTKQPIDIAQTSDCTNDYLQIRDGSNGTKKWCGKTPIGVTMATSGELSVIFHTDGTENTVGKGFRLEITAKRRPLPEGCSYDAYPKAKDLNLDTIGQEHHIMSLNREKNMDYIPDVHCKWVVKCAPCKAGKAKLQYSFPGKFDLENSPGCRNDAVVIEDGNKPAEKRCGSESQDSIATTGELTVSFKSNENEIVGKGFEIVVRSVKVSSPGSFTTGAIVGGVIGGLMFIVLAATIGVFLLRLQPQKEKTPSYASSSTNEFELYR